MAIISGNHDWATSTGFQSGLHHWHWCGAQMQCCTSSQDAAFVPADEVFGPCLELRVMQPSQDLICTKEVRFPKGSSWRITARLQVKDGTLRSAQLVAFDCVGSKIMREKGAAAIQPSPASSIVEVNSIHPPGDGLKSAQIGLRIKACTGARVRVADVKLRDITAEMMVPRPLSVEG